MRGAKKVPYREGSVVLPERFETGKIGVVTVTYGSAQVLPDFLVSLKRQTYRNFLLIVVDNDSKDNTIDLVKHSDGVEYTLLANDHNVGVAAGNNRGIAVALSCGCEFVLLLNNDVHFEGDLFGRLVDGLAERQWQMVTPMIYSDDRPGVIWAAGGAFKRLTGYRIQHLGAGDADDGQYQDTSLVTYVPTCCVLLRREVFSRIGLMDERYFVYSDDVDFMYRALCAGLRIRLLPRAKLWHKASSLTGGGLSDFSLFWAARGRTLFLCKHFGATLGSLWTAAYTLLYLLRPLLGRDSWHRAGVRLRGTLAGRRAGLRLTDRIA